MTKYLALDHITSGGCDFKHY